MVDWASSGEGEQRVLEIRSVAKHAEEMVHVLNSFHDDPDRVLRLKLLLLAFGYKELEMMNTKKENEDGQASPLSPSRVFFTGHTSCPGCGHAIAIGISDELVVEAALQIAASRIPARAEGQGHGDEEPSGSDAS